MALRHEKCSLPFFTFESRSGSVFTPVSLKSGHFLAIDFTLPVGCTIGDEEP
jgi:hypothetical protein